MQDQDLQVEKVLSKGIVEQSYQLPIGGLGKRMLAPVDNGEGRKGIAIVTDGVEIMRVSFQVVLGERPHVMLNFTKEGIARKQTIFLDTQKITFGVKVYFLCSCGRRCLKLYSRRDCYGFGCRLCENLGYEIHGLNRRGTFGAINFYLSKYRKIWLMQQRVKRVSYRGRFTRRAASVLRALGKWGLSGRAKLETESAFQKIWANAGK